METKDIIAKFEKRRDEIKKDIEGKYFKIVENYGLGVHIHFFYIKKLFEENTQGWYRELFVLFDEYNFIYYKNADSYCDFNFDKTENKRLGIMNVSTTDVNENQDNLWDFDKAERMTKEEFQSAMQTKLMKEIAL